MMVPPKVNRRIAPNALGHLDLSTADTGYSGISCLNNGSCDSGGSREPSW